MYVCAGIFLYRYHTAIFPEFLLVHGLSTILSIFKKLIVLFYFSVADYTIPQTG
jgi:hypothetical protein